MKAFVSIANAIFGRMPFCSVAGAFIGATTGFVLSMFQTAEPVVRLTLPQVVQFGLILALASFLFLLLVFGLLLRYRISAIFWPGLVNAVLTSLLTVAIANAVHRSFLTCWIGIIVGIIVGWILCRLCPTFEKVYSHAR